MEPLTQSLTLMERPRPEQLPETAQEWLFALPGAVAIWVEGRDARRTRAVTAMLHGNEPSGLHAVFRWLKSGAIPQTQLLIVIGAVAAARLTPVFSHRMMPGGRDLNRCFLTPGDHEEGRLAQAILEVLRRHRPEAVVDLHNNSGHNPAYGVSTRVDPERLGLVSLFARRFVVSNFGLGALMDALADELPIVTIESGRRLDPAADACAHAGLERYAAAEELPRLEAGASGVQVLDRAVRVQVRPGLSIGFGDHRQSFTDVTCAMDVDRHNFQELPAGTEVAWVGSGVDRPFEALDEHGRDVADRIFRRNGLAICTARELIPVMMTTDARIALADCLFYAVQRR